MNPVNILLVAAVIVFVIYRQMTTQRVGGKALLIPGALMVYGLYEAYFGAHPTGLLDPHHLVISVALFAIGLVLAAGLGVWRGVTVHAWRDDAGALWRKGTALTIVAWIVSIGSRVLVGAAGGYFFHTAETTASIMIAAGVSLIVQNLVISRRAHELTQAAPATVMGGTGVRLG